MVYKTDYQEQQDNPARTFEGLYRLLAFADAVDSTDGLISCLAAELDGLAVHASLGEQKIALSPGKDYVMVALQLKAFTPGGDDSTEIGAAADSSEQAQAFKQQVAAQVEQLLWLAYRLQLEQLVEWLHRFIRSLCLFKASLLRNREDVYSRRVAEAAGASGMGMILQALKHSVLTQEVALSRAAAAHMAVLEPLGLTAQQKQPLVFNAMLRGDVLGIPQGTKVQVQLDLFGRSMLRINGDDHDVHLRVGNRAH
jgi:hypothetical protein